MISKVMLTFAAPGAHAKKSGQLFTLSAAFSFPVFSDGLFAVDKDHAHLGGAFKDTSVADHKIGILAHFNGADPVINAQMTGGIDGDRL